MITTWFLSTDGKSWSANKSAEVLSLVEHNKCNPPPPSVNYIAILMTSPSSVVSGLLNKILNSLKSIISWFNDVSKIVSVFFYPHYSLSGLKTSV